jgi:drug/metabolite transporter (DMT)-like permease
MLAVSLALIACLNWGISGFLAGMKSRVMPVLTLLLFSSMAGVGMFLISVGVRGVQLPRDPSLLYAVLGGAVGCGGLYCFYRGLAVGSISIVVPVSALCVMLPVLTGLAFGEVLHPLQGLGMVVAVGGGVMVSLEKNTAASKKRIAAGILPALGAALGFGAFYVIMDLAGAVDPLWAATISRASFFPVSFAGYYSKTSQLKDQSHPPAGCFHHRYLGRLRRPRIHSRNYERSVEPGLRHQSPLSRRIDNFGGYYFERTTTRSTIFWCGTGHRGSRPHLSWLT